MQIQNYTQYVDSAPRQLTTRDRFVFNKHGHQPQEVMIMLVRKDYIICRMSTSSTRSKFTIPVSTWTQEDGIPMMFSGGNLELWVNDPTPKSTSTVVVIKRQRPAVGESKIAKCRAIYGDPANLRLSRDEMIAKFVSDAKCTPQGAVTYYLTCSKS